MTQLIGRIARVSVVLLAIWATVLRAQDAAPSVRIAALQFAISHGLHVPRDSVVVAREPDFDETAKVARHATEALLAQEAKQLATVLGPSAGDRAAPDVLRCIKYAFAATWVGTKWVVGPSGVAPSRVPPP
jgi:hypothetical protein